MNAIEIKNLRKNLGKNSIKIDDLKIPEGFVTGFIGREIYLLIKMNEKRPK